MIPAQPADSGPSRVGELLSRSLHDLRNPLAVVRACLEWLEVELGEREDLVEAVRDASTATTRMVGILEDLGVLARIESGDLVEGGVVDVAATLGHVASAMNARLSPRGVSVVALAAAPAQVPGDAGMIARAIEALVEVCARAAPRSGCVELGARAVELATGHGAIEISIGLSDAVAIDTTGGGGASIDALASGGIGAFLALRVAEAHRGSLIVERTTNVPRTILRLPLG